MADESQQEAQLPPVEPVQEDVKQQQQLKYLDFVQGAAIYVIVCFSTLYEYAKENAGPLRPGVQTVEGTVRTVIGPVYEKFHDLPFDVLKFADRKVDDTISELGRHVPTTAKDVYSKLLMAAHKLPEVAREVSSEVQREGVVEASANIAKTVYGKYEPMAKALYVKYEPVAEQYAVASWIVLNRLPLFPQVAHILVPTAVYWSERYNQAVAYATDNRYTASHYLPLIPIDRIAKVFENPGGYEDGVCTNGQSAVLIQS